MSWTVGFCCNTWIEEVVDVSWISVGGITWIDGMIGVGGIRVCIVGIEGRVGIFFEGWIRTVWTGIGVVDDEVWMKEDGTCCGLEEVAEVVGFVVGLEDIRFWGEEVATTLHSICFTVDVIVVV